MVYKVCREWYKGVTNVLLINFFPIKENRNYHKFEQWLEDSRVNFTERQAQKYMKVYKELGNANHQFVFDQLSLNKLYTLASAPEEVKEDVANSKDKEERKVNKNGTKISET